jgi:hypothetical protein
VNEEQCGQSPRDEDLPWGRFGPRLICARPPGHADGKPSERHEAAGYWWSQRQQAPVQQGHIHSTGYFCSPACPGYQVRSRS